MRWLEGMRAVVAALAALAEPGPAAASDRACHNAHLALVIGNSAYQENDAPLTEPVEGARRVAKALQDLDYEVVEEENVDHASMQAAFDELVASVKPRSVVFVYFSGFGVQSDRRTFLLPVDATIWSEADIKNAGIGLDRVLVEIAEKGATAEVVAVDAARRNPFERRFRASGSAGLAPISGIDNLAAILSAAPDKVFDPTDTDPDLFAETLARVIGEPDATAQSAFGATQSQVTRRLHGAQKPWTSFTLVDDLPLDGHACGPARVARGTPRPEAAPLPSASPSPPVAVQDSPEQKIPALPGAARAPAETSTDREMPPTRAFETKVEDPELLDEVRERLFEQDLDPGAAGSKEMETAIRDYEKRAGLPNVGYPTEGMLHSLREAASLQPWGAIAFAARAERWGMSWALPTRHEALAVAKSRCSSDRCNQVVSFFGHRCAAFAISAKGWAMTWRASGDASRQEALGDCGRHGAACRIVGAVCADGSEKSK